MKKSRKRRRRRRGRKKGRKEAGGRKEVDVLQSERE